MSHCSRNETGGVIFSLSLSLLHTTRNILGTDVGGISQIFEIMFYTSEHETHKEVMDTWKIWFEKKTNGWHENTNDFDVSFS